jgi:hypothetical protein
MLGGRDRPAVPEDVVHAFPDLDFPDRRRDGRRRVYRSALAYIGWRTTAYGPVEITRWP